MTQQTIPVGYKLTEVGVIPTDWEVKELQKLVGNNGLVRGPFGGSLKKEVFVKKGYKIYEQRNAIYKDSNIGEYYIDKMKFDELKRFEVIENDFIVSCSGTIGRIYQIPKGSKRGIINQALLKIQINQNIINDKYFNIIFNRENFQSRIIDSTQGGAMKNLVGMDVFRKTLLSLPPTLEEQTRIAKVLSNLDELITNLDELIQKKKSIKQGAMQKLLTPKKDWEVRTIEEFEKGGLIKLMRGNVISKKDINSNPGDYPIYSSSIHNNGLFGSYGKYMFDEELITRSVDGGGNFFYRPKHKFSVTNVCGYMRIDNRKINYAFLASQLQLLHSRLFFDYTLKAHPSVIRKSYSIGIPDVNEQIRIATILSDMDNEIQELEQKKAKYEQIKQGAMQQLLTGKIRLK